MNNVIVHRRLLPQVSPSLILQALQFILVDISRITPCGWGCPGLHRSLEGGTIILLDIQMDAQNPICPRFRLNPGQMLTAISSSKERISCS